MHTHRSISLFIPIIAVLSAFLLLFFLSFFSGNTGGFPPAGAVVENSPREDRDQISLEDRIEDPHRLPFGEVHRKLRQSLGFTAIVTDDTEEAKEEAKEDAKEEESQEPTSVAEELGVSDVSYTRYTTTDLNIRDDAHIDGERIGVFSQGDRVQVTGEVPNDWVRIQYGDTEAFVHGGYLQETDPEEEPTSVAEELGVSDVSYTRYTTTALNIRDDAHIEGERIGGFSQGDRVQVTGEVPNGWVRIQYGDTEAFVHGGYLTATDPTKAPADEDSESDPGDDSDDAVIVSDPTAIDVLVNRQYRLPADFTPPNLVEPDVPMGPNAHNRLLRAVAASALEEMFAGAQQEGITLYAQSGYRSYSTQETLFNNYVENHGYEAATRFSAKPGHSEHQTGLAMDVTSKSVNYALTQDFGNTEEGQWVVENAHRYGFIVRYPENKESITGYIYEPWHLRYLGVDLASAVHDSGLTYEEYLGY